MQQTKRLNGIASLRASLHSLVCNLLRVTLTIAQRDRRDRRDSARSRAFAEAPLALTRERISALEPSSLRRPFVRAGHIISCCN